MEFYTVQEIRERLSISTLVFAEYTLTLHKSV